MVAIELSRLMNGTSNHEFNKGTKLNNKPNYSSSHVAGVAGLVGAGCSLVASLEDATTEDAGEALPQKFPRGPPSGRLPVKVRASSPCKADCDVKFRKTLKRDDKKR